MTGEEYLEGAEQLDEADFKNDRAEQFNNESAEFTFQLRDGSNLEIWDGGCGALLMRHNTANGPLYYFSV